jgi:hypothetical protein
LLNIETPVTRNFIPQILLNVQDFYFHKVGYTSYDEGIFGRYTEHTIGVVCKVFTESMSLSEVERQGHCSKLSHNQISCLHSRKVKLYH